MRAPVFRNTETRNPLLGLTFPFEVVFVLVVFYAPVRVSPLLCIATTLAAYVAVRVVNSGRAPGFLQHWVVWQVRRARTAGLLSASARARCPRFVFAPHHFPDAASPARGKRRG